MEKAGIAEFFPDHLAVDENEVLFGRKQWK
jgi:hypothetical protein